MIIRKITHIDATYIKGIAILVIMLHNYFHILVQAPGENEFGFSIQNTLNLLHNLSQAPQDIIKQIFSFFGHYAVQVFVFLSGYGLATKYRNRTILYYSKFVINRFQKLYPTLLAAVLLLFVYKVCVHIIRPSIEINLIQFLREAFVKLTLFANLIPNHALTISGPWWFFSLIFQLYLIAPFILKLNDRKYIIGLILISSWVIQLFVSFNAPQYLEYVRLNFIGHLPEFCLGILLAGHEMIHISKKEVIGLTMLFIIGSFHPAAWIVSFIAVPLLTLIAFMLMHTSKEGIIKQCIIFLGKNSLYFFAVHALCRAPFVGLGNQSVIGSIAGAMLYILVVTLITIVFKLIVEALTPLLVSRLNTKYNETH